MATNTDCYKGGYGNGSGLFPCPIQCLEKTLDLTVDGADVTHAADDIYNIFAVPAGTFVFGVFGYIDTADAGVGGSLTFDVGDALANDSAVTVDGWIDGADAETAGAFTSFDSANYAASGGKFYTANSLITVKFLTVAPAGTFKARFKMICCPVFN